VGFNRGLGWGGWGWGGRGLGWGGWGWGGVGFNRGLGWGGWGWGGRGLGWGWGGSGIGLYGLGLGTGLGLGYGLGSYGLDYGGYGLGYGGYVPSYGVYTAGYGGYGYAPPYDGTVFDATSVPANLPAQPQQAPAYDNTANLTLVVPEGTELWFNGTKISTTGTKREFVTPPLTPGKDFIYEIKARWRENGKPVEQNQSVKVQANSWKVVDFTRQQVSEVPER
jgi:uncharacterized protein (TIGR03000 family)